MKVKAHCPFLGRTGYNAHARGFVTALSKLVDLRVDNYTACDHVHEYITDHQKNIISEVTLKGKDGAENQYPPEWKREIECFDNDIHLILHEQNHHIYEREYLKPTVAYCVWETELFYEDFFKRLLDFDQLWVPSRWQQENAIRQGYPADAVHVVPEAVESDCAPSSTVTPDNEVFTFCLLGRWDHRKSTTEILRSFVELFGNDPKVQLIASIDNPWSLDGLSTQERLEKMGWGQINNIIIKSFPSREDYIQLLQKSHVFLSCSRSEGWNIPLIEAMACGIPSIYSECSGQLEYAQGKGVPIRILGKEGACHKDISGGKDITISKFTTDLPGHFFTPDFKHLKQKMVYCMDNYKDLKEKALAESSGIRNRFTWENAATIACEHLKTLHKEDATKRSSFIESNTLDQWQQKAQISHETLRAPLPQKLFKKPFSTLPTLPETFATPPTTTHLMVVAHPDDETIFGFSELYAANKLDAVKWKVVCVAPHEIRSGKNRSSEFLRAMEFYGVIDYEVWDFPTDLYFGRAWEGIEFPVDFLDELDAKIQSLLNEKEWAKVVTHNPLGEYGHITHRHVFDAVKKHCDEFYVFCKTPTPLPDKQMERKRQVLEECYKDETIISSLETQSGDWFGSPNISTNYIQHGSVEKYDEKKDVRPFVDCWKKNQNTFRARPQKTKILLPLICYGGMCHTEFAMSVMGTLLAIQGQQKIEMSVSPITFESLISRARNASVAWALSDDFTHLLFLDSDICFDPADIFRLLEADKDVTVGLYPKKYYNRSKMENLAKHSPHVFDAKESWKSLATDFSTEFSIDNFRQVKMGEMFTVDYAATGFMLIKTDVFRKIIDKRPDLKYTNDVDGYMSANPAYFYDFFRVGVNPSSGKYESEDYGFCELWRSLGGEIHVVPQVKLKHMGRMGYPSDIEAQSKLFKQYVDT